MIPFTDLQAEYQECKAEIDQAIKYCLENNSFVTGPVVDEFEEMFNNYTGGASVASCNSGTSALVLALRSCGIGPGDEVITVSHTFISTPESVCTVGATPVFCDVIEETGLIDIDQAESLITDKTKAILWVDLYGQGTDQLALCDICKKHGLYSIIDGAHSFGFVYYSPGRRIGPKTGGDANLTCYSFNPIKNLGAIGDAGLLVGQKPFTTKAKMLRDHGRDSKYDYLHLGYNARINNIQAKVLMAKLPYLEGWLQRKREIAEYYNNNLKDYYTLTEHAGWGKHSYYVYVLRHPDRDKVRADLLEKGIQTNIHYANPAHNTPAFAPWHKDLPITEKLSNEIFSIPIYPHLKDAQVEYITNTLKEVR